MRELIQISMHSNILMFEFIVKDVALDHMISVVNLRIVGTLDRVYRETGTILNP